MKRFLILFALLLAALPAWALDRSLGPEEFTSLDELAFAVSGYFPKVQGEVKSVEGDLITIDRGRRDGLLPGMILSLWREGKEIRHPVTDAVIGRAEDEVGSAEVTAAGNASSTAALRKKLLDPRPGDRARITPKKIRIAVLPVRQERPEIVAGLVERLNEVGRFAALENEKIAAFLKDKKERNAEVARELANQFDLDAVVAVGVYPTEGKLLVTARIFHREEEKPLETIVALLNLATKRDALGDVRPFFAPAAGQEKAPAGPAAALPFEARFFVTTDLDGDGAAEYVFSDEARLRIGRFGAAGWQEVWSETVSTRERGMQQIHLDAADVNGNGRPEIFVTALKNEKVVSYAIEFQDGTFRRIADVPGFLRVIALPGLGAVLAGQNFDVENFFSGPVRRYSWSEGKYAPGEALETPKGVALYDFVPANFGEGRQLLVAFDADDRLVVYSGGTPVWKSEEAYRAVAHRVVKPVAGLDAALGGSAAEPDKSRQVRIHGRIFAVGLGGNGADAIIVPKNTSGWALGEYKAGELHSLEWTGARLESRWSAKDLAGPVLDYHVARQAEGGAAVLALVRVPGGLFGKDKYQVVTYEVK